MKTYILEMLDKLKKAQDELKPRVIDDQDGPLADCAEKIGEALTAVNYWQQTIEKGHIVSCTDIESTLEGLHDAKDSARTFLDSIDWEDDQTLYSFVALDQACSCTESFLRKWTLK